MHNKNQQREDREQEKVSKKRWGLINLVLFFSVALSEIIYDFLQPSPPNPNPNSLPKSRFKMTIILIYRWERNVHMSTVRILQHIHSYNTNARRKSIISCSCAHHAYMAPTKYRESRPDIPLSPRKSIMIDTAQKRPQAFGWTPQLRHVLLSYSGVGATVLLGQDFCCEKIKMAT